MKTPFEVGDRIAADDLVGWEYKGLSGKPGSDEGRRRFAKGDWILEVQAMVNPKARTRVMAIRTREADNVHWQETRERIKRHKK